MRIGFDAKRFFHNNTGLGNYSRDLIRILTHYFPENQYVLYNPKSKSSYSHLADNPSISEVNPSGGWKKIKSLWRLFGQKSQIKKDKIDVFHGLSGEIPMGLSENVKKVVTIHDLIFVRYPNLYSFFDRKIHFQKFSYATQKADCVIAISEQTKADIVEFLNINPEKIKVVYQGCSDVFKQEFSEEEKELVRIKLNLPHQFVLNVGTIEERKNALTILKAIKEIDTKLVLVGRKTTYYDQLESYAKQHNIEDKIIHLSGISQQELAIVYQLANVMVYPSIFEGFGIPIIEALFSKTPVITNNSGVFPEAAGEDSLYVAPYDDKDLAQKIKFLFDNPQVCAEISAKGHQFAQKFTDENIAENLMKVYRTL